MAKKIFAVFCNIFETTRKDILGVGRLQAYKYFNILTYRSIIRGRLHAKLRLTMLSIKKYILVGPVGRCISKMSLSRCVRS